ncbi:hypothetical protein AB9W99_003980 [Providencia rettgeri]
MTKYTAVIASALFISYQLPVHAGDLWSVGASTLFKDNFGSAVQAKLF